RVAQNWFLEQNESEKASRLRTALYKVSLDARTLLSPQEAQPPRKPLTRTSPEGLTRCELDVLRLLAQGLRSAQIAEQLVISITTVNSHLRSIYGKLGVKCRAAATRYAIEHHLV